MTEEKRYTGPVSALDCAARPGQREIRARPAPCRDMNRPRSREEDADV